jgi:hypothetical protein
MRKAILILTAAAALPLFSAPAQAQQYPWCAYYTGGRDGGGTNCGFVSFAQCQATIRGVGGVCEVNPAYPAAPPHRMRRHR